MIRRISDLIGGRFCALATAVAGAIALSACANLPAGDSGDGTQPAASTAGQNAVPSPTPAQPAATTPPIPAVSATPPTNTVTLPPRGKVSLSEYRARMREQLMRSENTTADVADCAAHASWVVPRSATYDALRIPTGALGAGQATVERWDGRFSQVKQAVPVNSVVTFPAAAHKRQGEGNWEAVKVRCGYDDGMMLAYELLDANGAVIAEPAAAPAVPLPDRRATGKSRKGAKATSKSSAKGSKATTSKSSAKSTTSTKSSGKASTSTTKKKTR